MREINAQSLDPSASRRVPHDVYGEQGPGLEFFHDFGTKENDERSTDEIPNHLIQEGGVEQRACRAGRSVIALFAVTDGASLHIQLQTPRQGRRRAVELLVEPVAQTSHGLRHEQSWRDGVTEQSHWIMLVTTPCPSGKRSKQDAAPDAQSAIPDAEHLHPIAGRSEETFRSGDDVVYTRTDDAARHRDKRDVENLIEITAISFPMNGCHPYRQHDAEQNAQRVEMDGHRPDGKLRNGG